MSSQALEIQDRLAAFSQQVNELDESPTPSEVHRVLTEGATLSKMLNEEVDLLLGTSEKLAQNPRDLQKIHALGMMTATPLLGALAIMFALFVSWRFHVGAEWAIFEAAVTSLLLSTVVFVCAQYRKRQLPQAELNQHTSQEQKKSIQDFIVMAESHPNMVKCMAARYDDPVARRQTYEKPWLTAVALLVLELAVCASCGQLLFFIAAFTTLSVTFFLGGAMANYTAPRPALFKGTPLEKAVVVISCSPILMSGLGSLVGILTAHGMPLVDVVIEPTNLLATFEKKLQAARARVAEVEIVREQMCRKVLKKTQFISSVENVIHGTTTERISSLHDLSGTTGHMSGAIARRATSVLGMARDDPRRAAAVEQVATMTGDVLGSLGGIAASLASPRDDWDPRSDMALEQHTRRLAQGVQGLFMAR